jgi:hypothetical protein
LEDLIELRKLRKTRQGIDAAKLNKGDAKKKKKRAREEEGEQGGLKKGVAKDTNDDDECVHRFSFISNSFLRYFLATEKIKTRRLGEL